MTSAQIKQVIRLQEAGKGYRTIASELGLSINSVKSWCRRHPVEETPINGCKQCSAPLIQFPGKRKRIYCSDRCRYLWWAAHPQKPIFISESGLYSLILSSKLERAKKFKRWVTAEVLPSIRKHGAYMTDSLLDALEAHPEAVPEYLNRLRSENARNRELTRRLRLALPKAEYYDAFVDPADCTNIRTTAKELGVPEKQFTRYLEEKKYLFRDKNRKLFPRAVKKSAGLFLVRDFYTERGKLGHYTLITPAGKRHFLERTDEILFE